MWPFAVVHALSVGEVRAQKAVQLGTEELKQTVPGAKVMHRAIDGTIRRWENKTDETLVASSDAAGVTGGRRYHVTGAGTWRVQDDGRFCVTIKWTMSTENSCWYIFKAEGKYFSSIKLDDAAPVGDFEFSR